MTLTTAPAGTLSDVTPDRVVTADSQDGITRYLRAGDQMARLMDATLKTSSGVGVLVLAAWVLGLLPAAVRLM
jgi:hypothetical protein